MTGLRILSADVLRGFPLPDPGLASDKNSRGRALVVAGSSGAPGAALLAGEAALCAGAGKVQMAIPRSLGSTLGIAFPEAGILRLDETEDGEPQPAPLPALGDAVGKSDAILVGPGLMHADAATELARFVAETHTDISVVLDALALCDVMDFAGALRSRRGPTVLTPHYGEMAAMLKIKKREVEGDPLKYARTTAVDLNVTVVLKAATSYVATPQGEAWEHRGGVVGLATAGSGDVLAGILTGLLARGANTVTASLWAVYAHAQAGRILSRDVAPVGFLARQLLALIPKCLAEPLP